MNSRSSSPSEGEIIESGSEKATKSLPSANGIPVDRNSRKRVSLSRSPSPYRSSKAREPRSRSRSPFREDRGSKRRREDDHYGGRPYREDSRSFRVHYEERRHDGKAAGRGSYRDLDRESHSSSSLRYDEYGLAPRSREKRPRTVSRSPPRFRQRGPPDQDYARSRRDARSEKERSGNKDRRKDKAQELSREQSVSERAPTPNTAATSGSNTEPKSNQAKQGVTFRLAKSSGGATDDSLKSAPSSSADEDTAMATEPPDQAALIEQRRKRREAIKAKHKEPEPSLLIKALNASKPATPNELRPDSQPDTPGSASKAIDSLNLSPPITPDRRSGTTSPTIFDLSKEQNSTDDDGGPLDEMQREEPSAADYDPTMDMQEDKLRNESRQHGQELSTLAYDETEVKDQDILIPDVNDQTAPPKTSKEFDMFAEDEDESFADNTPAAQRHTDILHGPTRAIPVQRAAAIDMMSMLDDWDDAEGYYKIILGELLDGRYHVQSNLGRGMFSGVVRATDQVSKKLVAIKIIKSNETMRKAAAKEIEILHKLNERDAEDKKHIIRLERNFEHKGHLCMVFENLSMNLREVMKRFGRDVGINLKAVRAYAQQMFLALGLLRKCNMLHADLKPDNILVNEARTTLKVCDLGSASDASENEITPYLVSRFYRAPEIILGLPYDFAIDTWSIGCTLYELYTGKILFTGRTNNQMLRSIMECRGKFSSKLLRKAQFTFLHFDDLLNFRSVETDKLSGKDVIRVLNFNKPSRDLRTRLIGNATRGMTETESRDLASFVDLLEKCLNLNPEKRCTPSEALKHPFIMRNKS